MPTVLVEGAQPTVPENSTSESICERTVLEQLRNGAMHAFVFNGRVGAHVPRAQMNRLCGGHHHVGCIRLLDGSISGLPVVGK